MYGPCTDEGLLDSEIVLQLSHRSASEVETAMEDITGLSNFSGRSNGSRLPLHPAGEVLDALSFSFQLDTLETAARTAVGLKGQPCK